MRKPLLGGVISVVAVVLSACSGGGLVPKTPVQVKTLLNCLQQVCTPVPPVVEYKIPSSTMDMDLHGIIAGPDGNIWVSESLANMIARVTPAGVVTEFAVPTANAWPGFIAPGPDGALWFSECQNNAIGRVSTAGVVTEFPLPAVWNNGTWTEISAAAGPDGNLWFVQNLGMNAVGVMSTSGTVIATYPIPTANSGAAFIVKGSDGNMWFGEGAVNKIARITMSGKITEFPIPTPNSDIYGTIGGLAVGTDGNLWFTERPALQVGRLTPAGLFSEFPVTTQPLRLVNITATPDGSFWMAAWTANPTGPEFSQIFRMNLSGVVVDDWAFEGPAIRFLTTGSDGNVWFTDEVNDQVGRL